VSLARSPGRKQIAGQKASQTNGHLDRDVAAVMGKLCLEPGIGRRLGERCTEHRHQVELTVKPSRSHQPSDDVEVELMDEPLREFSVTSKRYGYSAATRSLDELPPSLRNTLNFISNLPTLPRTSLGNRRPFLPPQTSESPKPTLVLDLDETLVHCNRSDGKNSGHPISLASTLAPDLLVEFDDKPSYGGVCFRPFVHIFLEVAAKSFELVIFTASQQSYANKVIDALDPEGTIISHRLYRQHCTELRGAFFKEIALLGRPLSKCILVDNSPISVACNADHSILVRSWYGDTKDKELMDLLGVLQEIQYQGGDVSRYLVERYALHEFFQAMREHRTKNL